MAALLSSAQQHGEIKLVHGGPLSADPGLLTVHCVGPGKVEISWRVHLARGPATVRPPGEDRTPGPSLPSLAALRALHQTTGMTVQSGLMSVTSRTRAAAPDAGYC